MKKLIALTICLMFPCLSFAQCRTYATSYATTNYASTYVAPTYYQTALVAVLPAIFVPSASYTVGVSAAPVVAAPTIEKTVTTSTSTTAISNDIAMQMLTELKAMRQESRASNMEIKNLLGRPMPKGDEQIPPPKSVPPGVSPKEKATADAAISVLQKPIGESNVSCATCHNPSGKNGGLIVFNSKLEYTGLSEDEALAMAKKVTAERVCPRAPGALKGEDKETVLRALPPPPAKEEQPLRGMIGIRRDQLASRQ